MATTKKNSSKFEDVAKPGKTPASANARPTITGHQPSIKQDPMMSSKPEEDDVQEKEKTAIASSRKIRINPISDDLKAEPKDDSDSKDAKKEETSTDQVPDEDSKKVESDSSEKEASSETAEDVKDSNKPPEEKSSDAAAIEAVAEATNTKKEDSKKAEEELKKRQQVDALVKSRTYSLPIVEGGHKTISQKITTWLFLLMLLIAVGTYLAVDAGYINIGFDLPYDFIKN
jgi:hypothetical protein